MNEATYTMKGRNIVVIDLGFTSWAMNEDSLVQAIENITARRHEYHTEEAWQRNLDIHTRALNYLHVHRQGWPPPEAGA